MAGKNPLKCSSHQCETFLIAANGVEFKRLLQSQLLSNMVEFTVGELVMHKPYQEGYVVVVVVVSIYACQLDIRG